MAATGSVTIDGWIHHTYPPWPPVPNANVILYNSAGTEIDSTTTDVNGDYILGPNTLDCAGSYTLTMRKLNYKCDIYQFTGCTSFTRNKYLATGLGCTGASPTVCTYTSCTNVCEINYVSTGSPGYLCPSPNYCDGAGSCIAPPACTDSDGDGYKEGAGCTPYDYCPGTASGAVVDSNGCSCAQKTCPVNQQCNPTTAACECSNPCSSGQRQCSGNSYQLCAQDANGCWYWGTAVACTSPTPTCYNGVCVSCTLDSECVTPPDDTICYLSGTCTAGSCLYTKKAEGTSCGTNKQCDASGMCVCSAGYTACPDGNCYNFQTDPNNCGSCGYTCSFANAVATCSAGICVMGACNAGYYDIDNDPIDGCEYACTSSGAEICGNEIDEDCDGADLACLTQCSDGLDNDNNGCADYPTDSGCYGLDDGSESGGSCPFKPSDESDADFTICHIDTDGDGVCDLIDNCDEVRNPDQVDVNNNGVGDACEAGCVRITHDNTIITEDTLLCRDTYYVTDPDLNGVIQFGANNIFLDCNDATLVAEQRCNLPGDVNRNNVLDGEDAFVILDAYKSKEAIENYESCISDQTVIDECNAQCEGSPKPQLCKTNCLLAKCGSEPSLLVALEPCMDANQDGSINNEDYLNVVSRMVCLVVGDVTYNGILDNMDALIIKRIAESGEATNLACTDVTGDGQLTLDDYEGIFTEYLPHVVKYYDEANDIRYCDRTDNGMRYFAGDINYDGYIRFDDLYLINLMRSSYGGVMILNPSDTCISDLDGVEGIGAQDADKIRGIISGYYAGYPVSQCTVPGDANENGYLEGFDTYLILQDILNPYGISYECYPCCDADENGVVETKDIDTVSEKLYGTGGTGIEINNKVGVSAFNCNLQRYSIGINMTSSAATIIRNVFNTTSYGIKINEG